MLGIPSVVIELVVDGIFVIVLWIIVAKYLYNKFASN